MMLMAIHVHEIKSEAQVIQNLRDAQLKAAAQKVMDSIEGTLTFMDFPTEDDRAQGVRPHMNGFSKTMYSYVVSANIIEKAMLALWIT